MVILLLGLIVLELGMLVLGLSACFNSLETLRELAKGRTAWDGIERRLGIRSGGQR